MRLTNGNAQREEIKRAKRWCGSRVGAIKAVKIALLLLLLVGKGFLPFRETVQLIFRNPIAGWLLASLT